MDNAAMMGAIGSGLGLLKGMKAEKDWERQRQVEALKTAYSPILGTMGDMGSRPDKFQSALDFGVKGMSLGMAMDKHKKDMSVPKGDAKSPADAAVTVTSNGAASNVSGTGVNQLSFAPEAGTSYGSMTNQTLADVNPNMSLMPDTGVNRLSFMDNTPMSQDFGVQQLPNQFDTLQQDLYRQPYFGATQAPQSQAPRFGINQLRMYR